MPQAVEEPQLVGEDWEPSTFEDSGAAELGARIRAAAPLPVPKPALEGRCGLEDRELWQLGVQTVPAGALSTGGGVLLRLVILAAAAAMGFCLAMVGAASTSLNEPDSRVGVPGGIVLTLCVALVAHGFFRLAWGAAGRERERRLAQRRVAVETVDPVLDHHGRLTVAVLDGPGVLRVLLLWLRGHPQDADMLEVRVVAERRVPRDEPSRAEDAVAALSEVVVLAADIGAATDTSRPAPAAGVTDAKRLVESGGSASRAPARTTASRLRVGPDWQPDGTTEAGEAELARRLCVAKPRRWSAELLAPLVIGDVRVARHAARTMPRSTERRGGRRRPTWVTAPALTMIAFLLYFVASSPSVSLAGEVVMRGLFLAAACWLTWKVFRSSILELPHRWRRRPLLRRVDDAACDAAAGLESGLPGGHGAVMVVTAEQNRRRVVQLAHVRRVVDAREGTIEVRVLAERRLEPEDDVVETVGRFLRVADDQAFTTQRGRERVELLRRLSRRLGVTAGRGRGRGALLREPLAIVAALTIMLGGVLAVAAAVSAVTAGGDALALVTASAVLIAFAVAILACARRWTRIAGG